jgi:hypothetical protein
MFTSSMITTGSVGIGTATPGNKLHVYSTTANDGILFQNAYNGSTGSIGLYTTTAAGNFILDGTADAAVIIPTGGKDLFLNRTTSLYCSMVVKGGSGYVGIGTTAPAFSLSVKNTQAIYGTGALGSTAATGGNLLFYTSGDTYAYPTLNLFQYDHNNCGILFDMYFGAGWFNATTGTGYGIHKNSNILQFTYITGTAGTVGSLKTAMAINSSGYLGIGMTNPHDVLHTMSASTSVIRIGASTAISSVSQLVFDQAISQYWHGSGYGNNPTTGARGAAYGAAMIQSGNESDNNYENSYMTFHTCRDPQSDGTGGLGVLYERMRINSLGYVGIGTNGPTQTLDVNGPIARSGMKLPRVDYGTLGTAGSITIPILFSDTQYNMVEIRVRYVVVHTTGVNINISATSTQPAALNFNECGLTTVKYNDPTNPVQSFVAGNTTSLLFASGVEQIGIEGNLLFRMTRTLGTNGYLRNHYSYDNVYTWTGIGTAQGTGRGHIDTTSMSFPIASITLTPAAGTINCVYNTTHYN